MTLNLKLAIATITAVTLLSGCAESQTFGQGVNTVLNSTVQDIQTALMGTSNTTNTTKGSTGQLTNHSTDWTPYLRSMQAGCKIPDLGQIPNQYRSSIGSIQRQGDPNREGEDVTMTYNLVNATAFGYSLQKIEQLQGYEWGHLKVYFKDSSFTALRPQFKLPNRNDPDHEGMVVEKNNASGYEIQDIGYTVLEFNAKEKSISCFSGL